MEAIKNISKAIDWNDSDIDATQADEIIRQSAMKIAETAIYHYTGFLLKSSLKLVDSIVQFANDLECNGKQIES